MEIVTVIWQNYLYIPLFNLLVWLYLNYSSFNLGIAVIILTVILRILLLPFTVLTERGKLIGGKVRKEIIEIKRDHATDPVKQKILIRRLLKKKKIRPWAKAVTLSVQGLVLVLLYQVFLGGINTTAKLHLLYPGIPRPDFINTSFLWFDIGKQNLLICAIVAGYIYAQILINFFTHQGSVSKKEQIYSLFFPAFAFLILAILPAVKSVFILTSLLFSSIISMITALIKLALIQAAKKPAN
ncbi:MAG: YidC/Oxa1 family membrane protein insertase [Candidatus Buchananbacteria bacterium]